MSGIDWFNKDRPLLRGDKIEDQNGRTFIVSKEIGHGFLSHVYKVVENIPLKESQIYAIKVPLDNDDSKDAVDFEAQVLQYVCIFYLQSFLSISTIILFQRIFCDVRSSKKVEN